MLSEASAPQPLKPLTWVSQKITSKTILWRCHNGGVSQSVCRRICSFRKESRNSNYRRFRKLSVPRLLWLFLECFEPVRQHGVPSEFWRHKVNMLHLKCWQQNAEYLQECKLHNDCSLFTQSSGLGELTFSDKLCPEQEQLIYSRRSPEIEQ